MFFSISEARRQLNILWIFLRMYFDVRVSTSCSTHVHISPRGFVAWKKSQLAALAKAVIYFDPVVAAVMPESRRRNHFCLGNIHSEPIKALLFRGVENFGLTPTEDMKQVAPYYGDVFKKIDETLDDKQLVLLPPSHRVPLTSPSIQHPAGLFRPYDPGPAQALRSFDVRPNHQASIL